MKKVFVSMALAVLALGSQAQVLKNDLLKGYKVGDTLEKMVYDDKRAPINVDTWCGAFTTTPVEGVVSPTVGKALTYDGYIIYQFWFSARCERFPCQRIFFGRIRKSLL